MKLINSISIENYRGFNQTQTIDLADNKCLTLLIGQNNTGKSLIARALSIVNHHLNHTKAQLGSLINDYDFYDASIDRPIKIKIAFDKEAALKIIQSEIQQTDIYRFTSLENISIVYVIYKIHGIAYLNCFLTENEDSYETRPENGHQYSYKESFIIKVYNSSGPHLLTAIDTVAYKFLLALYNQFLIFAPIRSFSLSDNNSVKTGSEILDWIVDQRNASDVLKAKRKVGEYLKRLNLEGPLDVHVDKEKKQLVFTFHEHLKLNSDDVGTGYTMLYILLMEIIRNQKRLIIIDEIESHLQPGLVRELIKIIRQIGTQQYIISTHSPTVMESAKEDDFLYHFKKVDRQCLASKFYSNNNDAKILRSVANDLGIIPGDALLSNCVIWVEGPSEVWWLRAWMKTFLPIYLKDEQFNLLEGLHYSILMTGGSLISKIGFEENTKNIDDIEEDYGLKVLRINPNPFVIIDSDNSKENSVKFNRCIRIAAELNEQNKTADWYTPVDGEICKDNIQLVENLWLLKGKELENYCHPELLKQFYTNRAKHGSAKIRGIENDSDWNVFSSTDGAGNILESRGITGVKGNSGTIAQKDQLAKFIFNNFSEIHLETTPEGIEQPNGEMVDDLRKNLTKLLSYIRRANGLK